MRLAPKTRKQCSRRETDGTDGWRATEKLESDAVEGKPMELTVGEQQKNQLLKGSSVTLRRVGLPF